MDITVTILDEDLDNVNFALNRFNNFRQVDINRISGQNIILEKKGDPLIPLPDPLQMNTGEFLSHELTLTAKKWSKDKKKEELSDIDLKLENTDPQGQRVVKRLLNRWGSLSSSDKITLRNIIID